MRVLMIGLACTLITGCMHSGIPAGSVTDRWAYDNCPSVADVPKTSCARYRDCDPISTSSLGMCRCFYNDGAVFRGIISNGKVWCGVKQDGSNTLVVRNGAVSSEKTGVDWASTAILVAGVAVAAAVLDDDDNESSTRDDRTTQRRNESSSELGERLLREQRERGVSGSGRVAQPSTKTYSPANSTYNPTVGQDLYTIQTSGSNVCNYASGNNKVAIGKPAGVNCPVNIQAPSKTSSAIFDYSQIKKIGVTGYKLSESRRYCTYATPYGDIFIPKGEYATCPQSQNF